MLRDKIKKTISIKKNIKKKKITIKRISTEFDLKIKCQGAKLEKKSNLIQRTKYDTINK
jgi:hypothetical protein